eukprot:jgi/Mesvir1/24945/Mv16919-RA.1
MADRNMPPHPPISRAPSDPRVRTVGFNTGKEMSSPIPVPLPPTVHDKMDIEPSPVIIPPALLSSDHVPESPPATSSGTTAEAVFSRTDSLASSSYAFKKDAAQEKPPLEVTSRTSSSNQAALTAAPAAVAQQPVITPSKVPAQGAATPTGDASHVASTPASVPKPAAAEPGSSSSKGTPATGGDGPRAPSTRPPPEEKPRPTRAERRAIQEAQRAAKEASRQVPSGAGGSPPKPAAKAAEPRAPERQSSSNNLGAREASGGGASAKEASTKAARPGVRLQFDDKKQVAKQAKKTGVPQPAASSKAVELFSHLPQFDREALQNTVRRIGFSTTQFHPAITALGLKYAEGTIVGSNARCRSMLEALKQVIEDYVLPPHKSFSRDLGNRLNTMISFLVTCRPMCVSMGNAVKHLKRLVASVDQRESGVVLSESEMRQRLADAIDRYIHEKLVHANETLVNFAVHKIQDGDVVVTHGRYLAVETLLLRAHAMGKRFRVVLVDSRPRFEGRALLKNLLRAGLHCTYTLTGGLSFIMREATKVILGATAVLGNGFVVSGVGAASTAMMAHAYGKPVLICSETCKFTERVQLDSICSNELGDPDLLASVEGRSDVTSLAGWQDIDQLRLLHLTYDAMPAKFVNMIITEYGMVSGEGEIQCILGRVGAESILFILFTNLERNKFRPMHARSFLEVGERGDTHLPVFALILAYLCHFFTVVEFL